MSIDNGIVRWSDAPHSSRSRIEGHRERVAFCNQPSTIFIPRRYKTHDRRIFVLDDFTTEGYSLEAARNMLLGDGAKRVTMIAFGKYPRPHTVAVPRRQLEPRVQRTYTNADFDLGTIGIPEDKPALNEFVDLVGKIAGSSIGPKLLT